MTKRLFLMAVSALLLGLLVTPARAQDGGDNPEDAATAFIELIQQANANLYAAEYFSYSATQNQTQLITSGVGLRQSELARETQLVVDDAAVQVNENGAPVALDAEIMQTDSRRVNEVIRTDANLVVSYEMRLVEGQMVFVRITDISGVINENAISEIIGGDADDASANFITGWVNLTANPEQLAEDLQYLNAQSNEIDFFEALNLGAMLNLSTGITWTPDMVESISERATDDDNQRAFEVTLNPVDYLESLGLIALVESDALVGNTEQMLQEMFEGTTLIQNITLGIDEEAGPSLAIVQTQVAIDVAFSDGTGANENAPNATDGVSLNLDQETTTTITYDDIGDAFEVETPAPEISVEATCNQESLQVLFNVTNTGANMDTPAAFTVSREGEVPDDEELQLEAGTRTTIERRNGEFTLEIPTLEVSESITCVEVVEEDTEAAE
jgi:hypothetical protein